MDKALSLLGLARRAGRLAIGHDAVIAAVRAKRAALVLITSDASPRLTRALRAAGYAGPAAFPPVTAQELGAAIGKNACMIALEDAGFGAALMKTIREEDIRYVSENEDP